jgi:hypothetical protein
MRTECPWARGPGQEKLDSKKGEMRGAKEKTTRLQGVCLAVEHRKRRMRKNTPEQCRCVSEIWRSWTLDSRERSMLLAPTYGPWLESTFRWATCFGDTFRWATCFGFRLTVLGNHLIKVLALQVPWPQKTESRLKMWVRQSPIWRRPTHTRHRSVASDTVYYTKS